MHINEKNLNDQIPHGLTKKRPPEKKILAFFLLPLPPIEFRAGTHGGEKREVKRKQEQTKFYDLRRGITEDFQRLAKFQGTLSKSTQKITNFKRFAFLTFF